MSPARVVQLLDRFIVGQADAKRAVAVALRNRWRRHRIGPPMSEEVVPKNILMIGPTGCGKTEIARRLAKLADAPFVKVEATKFTEVGFHGRDVDQIIRDLVDNAIVLQRAKLRAKVSTQVEGIVEEKILDILTGEEADTNTRETFRNLYRAGQLDDRSIEVELPHQGGRMQIDSQGGQMALQELVIKVDKMFGRRNTEKHRMLVSECRPILEEVEMERLMSSDSIAKDAIAAAESDGIVFIDEIDKIVSSPESRTGADASSEGVQRDLLPIIEGSTISTKYGNVNTDHILFIASGAFHSCKPSDMMAELQGRLPIRVELKGLSQEDLLRILTEPEFNMVRQQQELLATEGVHLEFTPEALQEIASVAAEVNLSVDNIGARRLHTVMERIVEDISFHAPERVSEYHVGGGNGELLYKIDRDDVRKVIGDMLTRTDISNFAPPRQAAINSRPDVTRLPCAIRPVRQVFLSGCPVLLVDPEKHNDQTHQKDVEKASNCLEALSRQIELLPRVSQQFQPPLPTYKIAQPDADRPRAASAQQFVQGVPLFLPFFNAFILVLQHTGNSDRFDERFEGPVGCDGVYGASDEWSSAHGTAVPHHQRLFEAGFAEAVTTAAG
eukprot:scaffold772_cov339-Pavlova_lutheri.AAC.36